MTRAMAAAGLSVIIGIAALGPVRAADPPADGFWPQWRGPSATGVSTRANPPIEWSETKNIRWKVEIPGRGFASPVVWGDRIFLLTAVPVGVDGAGAHAPRGAVQPLDVYRFMVLAIDRRIGTIVWERTAREGWPHEVTH